MLEIILSVEFWKFAAPLFGAIIAWLVNEWRKRSWEQYQRKEERYKELLRCIKGFQVNATNAKELREEFLNQLNQCWLYCPDDIVKKGYSFLATVNSNNQSTNEIKEKALRSFVLSIRKDLLSRKLVRNTKLSEKDFQILKAN